MVYNYTIPRGPVAAMFSSPGPIYLLPTLTGRKFHDPRSVHNRGPAYPFGIHHKQYKEDIGPGPCYYPHPKMLRDGREGIPKYSMLARHPDVEQFQSPGPAAYKPTMRQAVERPPEYSFGVKHMEFRKDNIPGEKRYHHHLSHFRRHHPTTTTTNYNILCNIFRKLFEQRHEYFLLQKASKFDLRAFSLCLRYIDLVH